MIASLRGVVAEKNLNDAVIDVGGVGYRVFLSLLSLSRLPEEGQSTTIRIRTVVREEALDLYGFLSRAEEEMFLLLTSVSQVGPRLAINILSGLEVQSLANAIAGGDLGRLTAIHGVGRKTAERLVLELREKVRFLLMEGEKKGAAAGSAKPAPKSDLISALINLGYKSAQAEKAAEIASDRVGAEAPFELLFREALKGLRSTA
jgi:Holliday junction DNA helicase RuvA